MPQVTLNWTAPTQNTDGSPITDPITYNLYGGTQQTNLPLLQSGITGTFVTRTGVDAGVHYYSVTAVVDGSESAMDGPISVTVTLRPNAPTGLTGTVS